MNREGVLEMHLLNLKEILFVAKNQKTSVVAKDWSNVAKKEQVEVSDCFGLYLMFNLRL